MIVEEIMTTGTRTIDQTATIAEAAELLSELQIRHLPVVRDGEIVGMLSDRDLRSVGIPAAVDIEGFDRLRAQLGTSVTAIMTADPVTVERTQDVREAIDAMLEERVGALPVVEPGTSELVGIVSYVDLLRALRDEMAPE